jgi:hypothetical protein
MKKESLLLVFSLGLSVLGEQLFYESFDYDAGGNIGGQKGGEGFGQNRWSDKSGTKGDVYITWSGLSFSDLPVAGNAVMIDMHSNKKGDGINVVRPIGHERKEGSLWFSFLYKYEGDATPEFVDGIRAFLRLQSPSDKSIRFRMSSNSLNGGGIAVRQGGSAANEGQSWGVSIADEQIWLIVCEFPNLGKAEGGIPETWAFSASNYDILKEIRRVKKEDLTANCTAHAIGFAAAADLKEDDFLTLGVWSRWEHAGVSVYYDELRCGTEMEDVLIFPN